MKKAFRIVLILIVALALIWVAGRYGWKLAGFRLCDGSGISHITVAEEQVTIEGFDPGSFPRGCVGYISRQEGDTLYLGVRYSGLFGFFETGNFQATIPVQGQINEIILCTGNGRYPIWDRSTDPIDMNQGFFH